MWRYLRWLILSLIGLSLALIIAVPGYSQFTTENLVTQAQQNYQRGNFDRSLDLLERVNQKFLQEDNILQVARVQSLISLNQQQLGNWEQAQEAIDYGLDLISQQPLTNSKQQVLAQIWNAQGHLQLRKGKTEQAINTWDRAYRLYQNIGDNLGERGVTISRSQALINLGFYPRACNSILSILSDENYDCKFLNKEQLLSLTTNNSELWQVKAFNNLANSLLLTGNFSLADIAGEYTEDLRSQLNLESPLLKNKINLTNGNIQKAISFQERERGELDNFQNTAKKALNFYDSVIKSKTSKLPVVDAQLSKLDLLIALDEFPLAKNLIKQIDLPSLQNSRDRYSIISTISFARDLTTLKEKDIQVNYSWDDIAEIYKKANINIDNLDLPRLKSYTTGYLAELAYEHQLSETIDPEAKFKQALNLAQTNNIPEIAYRWQWKLGRIYRDRQERENAINSYQSSINTLQNLRSDLTTLDLSIQFSFKEQVEPVYRELTGLLLLTDSDGITQEPTNLSQAIDIIEGLKLAQLDNYFSDACVTFDKKNIGDLDEKSAVIYTIILPSPKGDRLETILSLPNKKIFHHETIIPNGELLETTNSLSSYIIQPDRTKDVELLSNKIYQWSIEPLEKEIAETEITTLVFVLDGVLQQIPLSTLYDGEKYLIEKYAIAINSGLQLINPDRPSDRLTALTAGISEEIQDFPPLTNVDREITNISSTLNTQTLLNKDFTQNNLTKVLDNKPYSIVHLATHGQFSSNPQDTFILLWDKKLNVKQFSDLLRNRQLKTSEIIDLLVLSACETARGDNRATLGLAGMSVRTGVSSTLATLWQVSDESTSVVMELFYKYLKENPNLNKAEALRLAQLELWKNEQKDWVIPSVWSPYILVGNWQ